MTDLADTVFETPLRHVLEQRKVAARLAVTREATLHTSFDMLVDQLVVRLESYVQTEKLVGDTKAVYLHLDFPASPWQHYKQKHANAWWLRWLVVRRPVVLKTHSQQRDVVFERYALYPESALQTRELGRPIIVESYREAAWRQ